MHFEQRIYQLSISLVHIARITRSEPNDRAIKCAFLLLFVIVQMNYPRLLYIIYTNCGKASRSWINTYLHKLSRYRGQCVMLLSDSVIAGIGGAHVYGQPNHCNVYIQAFSIQNLLQ